MNGAQLVSFASRTTALCLCIKHRGMAHAPVACHCSLASAERIEKGKLTRKCKVLSVRFRNRIRRWEGRRYQRPRERRSVLMLCCAGLLAHRAFESSLGQARNYFRNLPRLQRDLCCTSVHITMVAFIRRQVLLGSRDWSEECNHSNIFC